MLSFEEYNEKLCSDKNNPGWLKAYIDRSGNYYIQGYGGLGTSIFKKLEDKHPFKRFLVKLVTDKQFAVGPFKTEPDAEGIELARLEPIRD